MYEPKVVEASAGTPDEVDFDKIEDRVRRDQVGTHIQASAVVYSDGVNADSSPKTI
jgi:beta-glucosidase/6-phospho-beta-glucosidase/beta-galactosidase